MRRTVGRIAMAAAMLVGLAAVPARAQQPAPIKREPAFVTGVVRDTSGTLLSGATIDLAGERKRGTSDAKGQFRIDGLVAREVTIAVRRFGYSAMILDANLVPGENILTIQMEPVPQQLSVMRTEVEQTGLFGVVGDTAFDIVPGATVRSMSHSAVTQTNEAGQFVIDPFPIGADMLDVRKSGYRAKQVSFTMPPSRGIKLVVWLTPLPAGLSDAEVARLSRPPNLLVQLMSDLGQRRRWANRTTSRIATREILALKAPNVMLTDALRMLPGFSNVRASDITCVVADGFVESGRGLDGYNTDAIETVEIVPVSSLPPAQQDGCGVTSTRATSMGGGSRRGMRLGASAGSSGIASSGAMAAIILLRH